MLDRYRYKQTNLFVIHPDSPDSPQVPIRLTTTVLRAIQTP